MSGRGEWSRTPPPSPRPSRPFLPTLALSSILAVSIFSGLWTLSLRPVDIRFLPPLADEDGVLRLGGASEYRLAQGRFVVHGALHAREQAKIFIEDAVVTFVLLNDGPPIRVTDGAQLMVHRSEVTIEARLEAEADAIVYVSDSRLQAPIVLRGAHLTGERTTFEGIALEGPATVALRTSVVETPVEVRGEGAKISLIETAVRASSSSRPGDVTWIPPDLAHIQVHPDRIQLVLAPSDQQPGQVVRILHRAGSMVFIATDSALA